MLANVLLKDVGHHVAEVHDDPFRGRRPFDAQRSVTLGAEHITDMIGNRPSLAFGFSGAQHQIVGDGGEFRNVQDEDVCGLLVEDGSRDGKSFGL